MQVILSWYAQFVMNCHGSWHDQICRIIYTSYGFTVLWQILQLWSNLMTPSFGSALYFSSVKKMIQIDSQNLRWLSKIQTLKYAFLYRILSACLINVHYHKKYFCCLTDVHSKIVWIVSHVVSTYLETYEVHFCSGNACWQLSITKVKLNEEQKFDLST
jgi:hypothetical protein